MIIVVIILGVFVLGLCGVTTYLFIKNMSLDYMILEQYELLESFYEDLVALNKRVDEMDHGIGHLLEEVFGVGLEPCPECQGKTEESDPDNSDNGKKNLN